MAGKHQHDNEKNSHQILLSSNKAPCHPVDAQLSNTKLVFPPPNTTSTAQALDQGVLHPLKCHYRRMLVKYIVVQFNMSRRIDQVTVATLDAV